MEKIYANHISDYGLIFWIYNEFLQLSNERAWLRNEQRIWIGIPPNAPLVNKHMQRCPTLLALGKWNRNHNLTPLPMLPGNRSSYALAGGNEKHGTATGVSLRIPTLKLLIHAFTSQSLFFLRGSNFFF